MSIPKRLWHIARRQAARGWDEFAERAAGHLSDAARELEEFLSGSRTPPRSANGSSQANGASRENTPRTPPPPPARENPLAPHYRTLGVPVGSNLETVERAWRRLVLENHPDRFMHDPARQKQANTRLREINAAHDALEQALQA